MTSWHNVRNPRRSVKHSLRLHREKSLPICLPPEGRKKQSHGCLHLQRKKSMVIHWEILCRSNALLRLQREKFFHKIQTQQSDLAPHTNTRYSASFISQSHLIDGPTAFRTSGLFVHPIVVGVQKLDSTFLTTLNWWRHKRIEHSTILSVSTNIIWRVLHSI